MDDYKTLGLEQGASQKEIKRAYFSLVRKYSPEEAPEKFRKIREAYERLKGQTEGQGPMFPRPVDPLACKFLDLYWSSTENIKCYSKLAGIQNGGTQASDHNRVSRSEVF